METSQNLYGLFVVYRYVCVYDIIINFTIVVSIQTCLRFYLVLHRFSYMFNQPLCFIEMAKYRA